MPASSLQIASRANPRVKQLRAAFREQSRLSDGLVAIEGETLLFEAIRSGLALKIVFLSDRTPAPTWLPPAVERIALTSDVFASAVDTQAPQGIAALLLPRTWRLKEILISTEAQRSGKTRGPLVVIAAGLQDPGNLGTLIRSAEAFGASAVLTTPGTVSQWNQKALRASAGSVFRVPVIQTNLPEIAALKSPTSKPGAPHLDSEMWEERHGLRLFAAVADDPLQPAIPLTQADLTQPCAILIGNEGAGLSAELLALADSRITIPTPGRVESLNAAVAASLLLFEASRQRALHARGP